MRNKADGPTCYETNLLLSLIDFFFAFIRILNWKSFIYFTAGRTFITNGNTGKTFSDSVMMHKPSNNKFTDPVPKSGQQDKKSGAGKTSGNRKRRVLKDPPPKVEVPQTTTPKRVVDPRHPEPIPIQGDLKNGYSVSVSFFF